MSSILGNRERKAQKNRRNNEVKKCEYCGTERDLIQDDLTLITQYAELATIER